MGYAETYTVTILSKNAMQQIALVFQLQKQPFIEKMHILA